MPRDIYFQLVDHATRRPLPDIDVDAVVDVPDHTRLNRFRDAVRRKCSTVLAGVDAGHLHVYANRAVYDDTDGQPLKASALVDGLGNDADSALVVVVPARKRGVAVASREEQWEQLLRTLQWNEPTRFCQSAGRDWPYQGAPELVDCLVEPLLEHYDAWQRGCQDKQTHAMLMVASGPGTGKSRMLDEMKTLLCEAARQSQKEALVERMKNAYVFHVALETEALVSGSLLDRNNPHRDVSYRMLYQLSRADVKWEEFAMNLKHSYHSLKLYIDEVIDMLAQLEKVDDVRDMTVILCVDGLEQLSNDGTMRSDLYHVLAFLILFLNSSTAFAVVVCATTIQGPLRDVWRTASQKRLFLIPPRLSGEEVLQPRTRLERQLIEDMGGHGRALEALQSVLSEYSIRKLENTDPAVLFARVWDALRDQYGDILESAFFQDPRNCRAVVAVILSGRECGIFERIGDPGITVDAIRSFGLFRLANPKRRTTMFRLGKHERLECAFVLLVSLIRKLSVHSGGDIALNEYLTRGGLEWQRCDQFMAFYRQIKSIAFLETPVTLYELHAGARFGSTIGILITEPSLRTVVEAVRQETEKSTGDDASCFINRDGGMKVSDMNTIVINGASAPDGDLIMRVQLTVAGQQVHCNEVIQCKLLQSTQTITKNAYLKAREKAVDGDSDVFLLVTIARATEFDLPPRCGFVSVSEFLEYFGPFASRAYQCFLEPPDSNTASCRDLCRIEGLEDATAETMPSEKGKRGSSSREDKLDRLFRNKTRKTAKIMSCTHWDDAGANM